MAVVAIVFTNSFFAEDHSRDVPSKYICVFVHETKGCLAERIDYHCCSKLKETRAKLQFSFTVFSQFTYSCVPFLCS